MNQEVIFSLFSYGKYLSLPRSYHPKNGLFVFILIDVPHYPLVFLLYLTESFLSVLSYMEKPYLLSQLAYRQAVLSKSALSFIAQLNYGIEIDAENNIYILASRKFFLPATHPSCCPHAKNSLLGS